MLLASFTCTGAADDIVAAPGAGKRVVVHLIQWTMDGAGVFEIHFGTAAADTRIAYGDGVAGSAGVISLLSRGAGLRGPVNTALQGTTSANNLRGVVYYTVEAA